jgi:predicted AAA+ superfamily ATPase
MEKYYKRLVDLQKLVQKQKVIVIYGPRRVGKTTLLQEYLKNCNFKYRLDNGDNLEIQAVLSSQNFESILEYAQNYELIAIDEAQLIPNIGMGLKIMVDNIPGIRLIATGSASFALSQQIGEPLTGRKITKNLFPLSLSELASDFNQYELKKKMDDFLIFGLYPEIIQAKTRAEKIQALSEITNSYLLKDVLELERVKSSNVIIKLLKLLAFQVGSEVSLNELATQVKLDVKTVDRYLDILEKGFVIKSLGSFSRNLRKELSRSYKYYFYDNGIRNALVSQFNNLSDRNDKGALWENFLVMERLKKQAYAPIYANNYFWRTYDQKEIDWIEERDGRLYGYEFKWDGKKVKEPKLWKETYKEAEYKVIDRDNYLEFVM